MDLTNEISPDADRSSPRWVFFTNYWLVLLVLAREPGCRMRDIAALVGITERRAQSIVHELEAEGYVNIQKSGRRNVYDVNDAATLRHPLTRGKPIKPLLALLVQQD